MTDQNRQVTLYHCPYTHSTGALTLLEELGADYTLHVMNWPRTPSWPPPNQPRPDNAAAFRASIMRPPRPGRG